MNSMVLIDSVIRPTSLNLPQVGRRSRTMKSLVLFLLSISLAGAAVARAETAGHCIQNFSRDEGDKTFFNLRNACPSEVIVYFVSHDNPHAFGNARISGQGGIHQTYLETKDGIQVFACIAPLLPRDENGHTPTKTTNGGYTCQ